MKKTHQRLFVAGLVSVFYGLHLVNTSVAWVIGGIILLIACITAYCNQEDEKVAETDGPWHKHR